MAATSWMNSEMYKDLNQYAITYKEPFEYFVVKEFLDPARAEQLLNYTKRLTTIPNDAVSGVTYGSKVNRAVFLHQDFLRFIYGYTFRNFVKKLTGYRLKINTKYIPFYSEFKMETKGFDIHNDMDQPYDFVSLLYLSDDYFDGAGGRYLVHDKKKDFAVVNEIEPTFNTLLMFRPTEGTYHSIEYKETGWERRHLTFDWDLLE